MIDSAFRYSPELMRVLVNMRNDDNTGSETSWWAEYKPTISYKFLWGDDIDQADNFDFIYAHIKNLRRRLKDAAANIEIKTVYGFGYKLIET